MIESKRPKTAPIASNLAERTPPRFREELAKELPRLLDGSVSTWTLCLRRKIETVRRSKVRETRDIKNKKDERDERRKGKTWVVGSVFQRKIPGISSRDKSERQ